MKVKISKAVYDVNKAGLAFMLCFLGLILDLKIANTRSATPSDNGAKDIRKDPIVSSTIISAPLVAP